MVMFLYLKWIHSTSFATFVRFFARRFVGPNLFTCTRMSGHDEYVV